jgi:hypothetical protein
MEWKAVEFEGLEPPLSILMYIFSSVGAGFSLRKKR